MAVQMSSLGPIAGLWHNEPVLIQADPVDVDSETADSQT